MSNNRIINIHNGPNGTPPKRPVQMEDLLNSAQEDWKFKRRDEAFVKVLGALAMISQGVGQAIKTSEAALRVARLNCAHDMLTSDNHAHCLKCGWEPPKE